VRESIVAACVIFILIKIFACFIKTSLLAARTCKLFGTYMPMHIAESIACIIFLYMKIYVCLIKQSFPNLGGADDSIL
jgi:K+ transporter